MKIRFHLVAIVVALCAACAQPTADHKAQGAELLAPFKANLKSALVKGMEAGPVEAIRACSVQAPQISAGLSVDGVVMGRSSHKLRNPDNAPPQWLAPILDSFADGSADFSPRVVSAGNDRVGYVEPIMTQALCLTCHGESLQPEIATRINESYPEDEATGFKTGDFRGVFWVEFPES